MIKFNSISLKNFRSYKEFTTFNFSKSSFNLIIGKNGDGKSSIFRALIWCLIGTDSEGIRGNNLKNWSNRGSCDVTLKFKIDNKSYVLVRKQSPNKIILNDEEVDQKQVNDLFNFNMKLFSYITIMSQFSDQFINASNVEKLQIFTQILQLEKWDQFSENSKNKTHDLNNDLQNILFEKERLQGKLEALSSKNYDDLISRFKKEKLANLKEIDSKIIDINSKIKIENETITMSMAENNVLVDQFNSLEGNVDKEAAKKITNDIRVLENDQLSIQFNLKEAEKNISDVLKEKDTIVNKFKLMGNTDCKECGQLVSGDHAKNQIKTLEITTIDTIKNQENQIKDLKNTYNTNSQVLKNLVNKIDLYKHNVERLEQIRQRLNKISNTVERCKSSLKYLNDSLKDSSNNYDKEKSKNNPYLKEKIKNNEELLKVKNEIDEQNKNYKNTEIEKCNNEFWIKGFKEIKLIITEESINEFNHFCNNNLVKLGLDDWYIENSIDKVLKNKKIKKGFNTLISCPNNNEEVPLNVYSGGEIQRIKLAIMLGLIDFLNSRINTNIEIYDEPTQWLDNRGIDNILQILKDRSLSKGVYLIDHRDFKDNAAFDNVYEVTKNDNGSVINEI